MHRNPTKLFESTSSPSEPIDCRTFTVYEYYGYIVAGNAQLAIAINKKNGEDAHWFTRKTKEKDDIDLPAIEWALGWCYPGD